MIKKLNNWKTTIAGYLFAAYPIFDAVHQAYIAGYFDDKTGNQLWFGIAFIVIGHLAKDHDATGGKRIIGGRPNEKP